MSFRIGFTAKRWIKTSFSFKSNLENSRRVFVVKRRRRLPGDVVVHAEDVGVADDDELEGEARLVEPGVGAQVVELDVHLTRA